MPPKKPTVKQTRTSSQIANSQSLSPDLSTPLGTFASPVKSASQPKPTVAEVNDTPPTYCNTCNKECAAGVECQICNTWCHWNCAGLDEDSIFKPLREEKVHWFCFNCKVYALNVIAKLKNIEKEQKNIHQTINTLVSASVQKAKTELANTITSVVNKESEIIAKDVETKINQSLDATVQSKVDEKFNAKYADALKKNLTIMDEKATALSTTIDNQVKETVKSAVITENVTKVISTEVTELSEERDRIAKKKLNLIFSNVEETTPGNDIQVVNHIIQDKLNVDEDFLITNAVRLGKKEEGKDRLLMIQVDSIQQKKAILRKATELRKLDEDDEHSNVYIRPDLTKKQIEMSKNLVTLLKKEREKNKDKHYKIRNWEIVEVPKPRSNPERNEANI